MHWLVDLLYLLAGLAYLPVALYNALILGKNRRGWGERFGSVRTLDPGKRRVWIHGVSLGEINATPRLAEALRERCPDLEIVLSTTTDTGYARAMQLYGPENVFRFPLDLSFVVARVLGRVHPAMIVLMELEVWYNLVRMATRAGIPVVVANGRLTARSLRRFGWLGRAPRSMFSDLAWVGAQDETIAARFRELGVRESVLEITSSLKWDSAAVTDEVDGAAALRQTLGIDGSRPLWVCGSTGPGEEEIILDAYREVLSGSIRTPSAAYGESKEKGGEPETVIEPSPLPLSLEGRGGATRRSTPKEKKRVLTAVPGERPVLARVVHGEGANRGSGRPILAIVPRKPERFDEVARVIERQGFCTLRRSAHDEHRPIESWPEGAVLLGDSMGELRRFYSLADVVFVGRSLVPLGGSDPMEVAALAKPMIVGPHTENFELPIRALRAAEAIPVVGSARELASAVGTILGNGDRARELGGRARRVVLDNQGATTRTVEAIVRLLKTGGRRYNGHAPGDVPLGTGPV